MKTQLDNDWNFEIRLSLIWFLICWISIGIIGTILFCLTNRFLFTLSFKNRAKILFLKWLCGAVFLIFVGISLCSRNNGTHIAGVISVFVMSFFLYFAYLILNDGIKEYKKNKKNEF